MNTPWYLRPPDEITWEDVVACVQTMQSDNRMRYNLMHDDIAESMPYDRECTNQSIGRAYFDGVLAPSSSSNDDINYIANIISTFSNKQARNRPRVRVTTNGANWRQQRTAETLQAIIAGEFEKLNLYEHLDMLRQHAAQAGIGFIQLTRRGKNIHMDIVPVFEVAVSTDDAKYGKPLHIARCRQIDRGYMLHQYPEHSHAIKNAPVACAAGQWMGTQSLGDSIFLYEIWRRQTDNDDENGRYVACIHGAVICADEFESEMLPIDWLRMNPDYSGIFGHGISRLTRGIQRDINDANDYKHKICTSSPGAIVYDPKQHKAPDTAGGIALIQAPSGAPPMQVIQFPEIRGSAMQMLQEDVARIYDVAGVSQMATAMRKPAGLNSGAALSEYNDIESERYYAFDLAVERLVVRLARRLIELITEIAEEYGDYEATARKEAGIADVKLSELHLSDLKYMLEIQPASILPTTPAGKMERITQLAQAAPEMRPYLLSLLDVPDIQDAMNAVLRNEKTAKFIVNRIMEDGEYPIDSEMSDELLIKLHDYADSERLKLMRMEEADEPIDALAAAQIIVKDILREREEAAMQQQMAVQQQAMMAQQQQQMQEQ